MKTSDITPGIDYAITSGALIDRYGYSNAYRARVIEARHEYQYGEFGPSHYRGLRKGVLIETLVTSYNGYATIERRIVRPQDVKTTWSQYLALKQQAEVARKAELERRAAEAARYRDEQAEWDQHRDTVRQALKDAGLDGYINVGYGPRDAVRLTSEQAVALVAALNAAKVPA